MTVSVIMIVRDGARFLGAAIDSVLTQTHRPEEVLVVDGASTDDTVEIAQRRGVPVVQQPGSGIADARNHGIDCTTGELIAFLDHDDRWTPSKLHRQISALEASGADYCVTALRRRAPSGDIPVDVVLAPFLETAPVVALTPSTLLVHRVAFDTVGRFDPAHGHGCDTDWFARAHDHGLRRHDLDEPLVDKLLHDRNSSIDVAGTRRELLRIARASVERKRARLG